MDTTMFDLDNTLLILSQSAVIAVKINVGGGQKTGYDGELKVRITI